MTGQPVQAGTLHNGWNYAIDSFSDGVTGEVIGATGDFEFYSLALKEEADTIFIAINANLSLTGYEDSTATNASIAYGDLFFNFSGNHLKTANLKGELFAIRFAEVNDAGVTELGVYENVTAKSVTSTNSGFSNLELYGNHVIGEGGTPSMGDLTIDDSYFEQTGEGTVLNAIASGTKVGDIAFLDKNTLSLMGLDFGYFNATGSQTLGFSFDKNLLANGSFIAHIFAECANDGIAIEGSFKETKVEDIKDVPEPSGIAGIILMGLVLVSERLYKTRHSK
ncbi:XDD3 family exosortase-dependent surface protein [Coleofasciculus sp. LEGE 07092]|uniref:XDD3 family exosortase-dependent surface protein n=1 Tax=Coleofasciculus sp. LEGE 07092 TaxID=2777969 RepID=UPI002AD28C7A|nr:XDD3 family exosortase-dependent surface protein [Coleofasciculus sp. LEGE 07092]